KVGITLNIRFVTFETFLKLVDERTFDLASAGFTGENFPDPEANLSGKLADEKNTNTVPAFKNARADELIAQYNNEFDLGKRIKLMQEFDGIFAAEHHWIFEWSAPYTRFVYWNKFGQPTGLITNSGGNSPYIGNYFDANALWWA